MNSRGVSITFERLGFKALAAGLVFKLVVFTEICVAKWTLINTTAYRQFTTKNSMYRWLYAPIQTQNCKK